MIIMEKILVECDTKNLGAIHELPTKRTNNNFESVAKQRFQNYYLFRIERKAL